MVRRYLFLIVSITFACNAWSGSGMAMEMVYQGRHTFKLVADKSRARMDVLGAGVYMILDMAGGTVHLANDKKKTVIDLTDIVRPGKKQSSNLVSELSKVAGGYNIAGIPSGVYEFKASGKHCGMVFGVEKKDSYDGLEHILYLLVGYRKYQLLMSGSYFQSNDACSQLENTLPEKQLDYGMLTKWLDAKGREVFRITRIETGRDLDASLFSLPRKYAKVSSKKIIQETQAVDSQEPVQNGNLAQKYGYPPRAFPGKK